MKPKHPITPPPDDLVEQWRKENLCPENLANYVATQAARWGADQELKACCEWVEGFADFGDLLRSERRPKPPSLKEQALGALYAIATGADDTREFHQDIETIKTALQQLDD